MVHTADSSRTVQVGSHASRMKLQNTQFFTFYIISSYCMIPKGRAITEKRTKETVEILRSYVYDSHGFWNSFNEATSLPCFPDERWTLRR